MKESMYNFFMDYDDNVLAYNARSNALAIVKKNDIKNLKADFNGLSEKLIEELSYGGFLIEDDFDEKKAIRLNQQRQRFDTTRLGLTIAPTLGCNFGCVYCYEHTQDDFNVMSEEIQDKLVEYVKSKVKTIRSLNITWYGGEPLLAMGVITRLSEKFINICEENDIQYGAYIVTNGYFLNENICKILKEYKITGMQITLDGSEETHNSKRPLKNGEGTFDVIFDNLEVPIKHGINVSVRINTDKHNINEGRELIKKLKEKGIVDVVNSHVARITPTVDKYGNTNCLSVEEFANVLTDYHKALKESNADVNLNYPSLKGSSCGIDQINSFVVDPKGNLYKCWDHIGNDNWRVASLVDNSVKNSKANHEFFLFDPTVDDKCRNCKILPICMGGCPYLRISNNEPICSEYIIMLENVLKIFSDKIKSQRKGGKKWNI